MSAFEISTKKNWQTYAEILGKDRASLTKYTKLVIEVEPQPIGIDLPALMKKDAPFFPSVVNVLLDFKMVKKEDIQDDAVYDFEGLGRILWMYRETLQELTVRCNGAFHAENKLDNGFQASPAVIGNTLIVRSTKHLYCIAQKE